MGDDESLAPLTETPGLDPDTPTPAAGNISGNRPLVIAIGIGIVVFIALIAFLFRGGGKSGGMHFVQIVQNLTREDAALIRAELSYLDIPSRSDGIGKNLQVFVPAKYKDRALNRLAMRGLPAGNIQGFRLFDKQDGLGSTDFDKRIKYIRALSGELSIIITRLSDIEDARVQIVLPEKQLFSKRKSKVSASVLLKVREGKVLQKSQVEGIAQLVASSVEDLSKDNVTIVDINGFILHGSENVLSEVIRKSKLSKLNQAPVKESNQRQLENPNLDKETTIDDAKQKVIGLQEKIDTQMKFKKSLEQQLEAKAQAVLDTYFPPGASLAKIDIALPIVSDLDNIEDLTSIDQRTILILVNNEDPDVNLELPHKKEVYQAVAGVVGYRYGSSDIIDLQRAPNYFTQQANSVKAKALLQKYSRKRTTYISVAIFLIIFIIYRVIVHRKPKVVENPFARIEDEFQESQEEVEQESIDTSPELEEVRSAINSNPDQIVNLVKNWLSEDIPK